MNCRFAICIPVYNNPKTIVEVIEKTLSLSPYPLIVVDDGSDISVESLYLEKNKTIPQNLSFIRHEKNQGKGVALQTAFKVAVERSFTHLVTLDGDGQHDPADISKLIDCAILNPWSLIVGDRDMQTENVPGSSSFGKKFSNFWVQYQTSVGVSDSQSGYRLYPLFHVQNMNFYCTMYEFEIEVLIRLIWKKVNVKNVKVSVKYFPPESRVSHFNKLRDNFRITMLNICLTVASLLREQTSPVKSAAAIGLGVFIGCTPLFGLHTLILAAMAFFLRLNFVYLWVGSQVSLPPFVPLLLVGAHFLGHAALESQNEASALVIGSLLLGLILGLISFAIVFWMKRKGAIKPGEKKKAWTGKNRNHIGTLFVKGILQFFGMRPAYWFLRLVAFYYLFFSLRARKSFTEYWKVIHPEIGFWKRQIKIYNQIYVFAQTLVDRARQRMHDTEKGLYFDYKLDSSTNGFSQKVQQNEKGTIIIASHIGGWDMAISFFARLSTGKKMMAVMYGIASQYQHHSTSGKSNAAEIVHYNENENTIMLMRNHLVAGNVVTVMGDRPVSKSSELMPFFGKLALFDTTPIRMALTCKSSVYYVFAVKEGFKNYRIFTFSTPPMPADMTDKDEQIRHYLKSYISYLERIIRDYPEQWFNFFPFWSEVSAEAQG